MDFFSFFQKRGCVYVYTGAAVCIGPECAAASIDFLGVLKETAQGEGRPARAILDL